MDPDLPPYPPRAAVHDIRPTSQKGCQLKDDKADESLYEYGEIVGLHCAVIRHVGIQSKRGQGRLLGDMAFSSIKRSIVQQFNRILLLIIITLDNSFSSPPQLLSHKPVVLKLSPRQCLCKQSPSWASQAWEVLG